MRSVPPADPRRDELYGAGGEPSPAGPGPGPTRGGTRRVVVAALLMLVALAIIAVIVFV